MKSSAPRPRPGTSTAFVALVVCVVVCVSVSGCSTAGSTTGAAKATTTSASGGRSSATLPPLAGVQLTRVTPSATNPRIGAPDGANLAALDPSVPANGRLFVFLPGTGGMPRCCQLLLRVAATMGYAAIGLGYPNTRSVDSRCGDDLACYGAVRQNELDGTSAGPESTVAPDNAIESRLVSMLAYLARTQPSGPWSRFLHGRRVDWSRVVVGGHSQGGGEAAYIGTVERVAGVVMLSSVLDSSNTTPPVSATYLTSGHRTPLDRYAGFAHTGDPFFTKITTDWSALGLDRSGTPASVDGAAAPYGDTHQLTTSVAVPHRIVLPEHDATAVDVETPRCPDGTPRYLPVWRYLLEVAGGLPIVSSPNRC